MFPISDANPAAGDGVHGAKRGCKDQNAYSNLPPIFLAPIPSDTVRDVEEGDYRAKEADCCFDQHEDGLHGLTSLSSACPRRRCIYISSTLISKHAGESFSTQPVAVICAPKGGAA